MSTEFINSLVEELKNDLYGKVLPFWCRYSVDPQGGFFNCLEKDGSISDTTKHIWLQGRQCWMWFKLVNESRANSDLLSRYSDVLPPYEKPKNSLVHVEPIPLTVDALLEAAERSLNFLRKYAICEDGSVYFALNREGEPFLMQRKIFSATFLIMALAEGSNATGNTSYWDESITLLDRVFDWISKGGPSALGKPTCSGAPTTIDLATPMIMLNVISVLNGCNPKGESEAFYLKEREEAVRNILLHVQQDRGNIMMEYVLSDGSIDIEHSGNRVLNPGHAIEAGWFLLSYGMQKKDDGLCKKSLDIINANFKVGWDTDNGSIDGDGPGGIRYFVDVLGYTPTDLSHESKLWWPLCESLVAFALAFEYSLDETYLKHFVAVKKWINKYLRDDSFGEWYGYADKSGRVTHNLKGGPYKGCFHVPRSLLFSYQILERTIQKIKSK